MKVIEPLLFLSLAFFGSFIAHALLSRIVKSLLWAWTPLASNDAEACSYQRSVYCTADKRLWPVVGSAGCAGAAWGVGLLWPTAYSPWWMLVGVLGVLSALALDLQRWERVAVGSRSVWFQRGLGQVVHQVLLSHIRDVQVQECSEHGFTFRHGFRNRSARLNLHTDDHRQVPLPKTDALCEGKAVKQMADFIRLHIQQQHGTQTPSSTAASCANPAYEVVVGKQRSPLPRALKQPIVKPLSSEEALKRALQRQRLVSKPQSR